MRGRFGLLTAMLIVLAPAAFAQEGAPPPTPAPSHKGKFLVADPSMPDPRFAGTVVFVVAHSREGALGLVINRPALRRSLADLMRAFDLDPKAGLNPELEIFWGGPVEGDRTLLLLHSDEFKVASTTAIAPGVALSVPKEALEAIAEGRGPKQMLLVIGYSGWAAGQLERELEAKGWAVISADADLLFGADHDGKWERAWKLRTQEL
jgi:putative transcriptional regulator